MRIIIEGCDGTGKTTLVNGLAKEFNLGKIHISNKDPNDLDFYYQFLRKDDVIFDRNLIGEMIYPNIFNRPQKLKEYELDYLMAKAKELNIHIIILTAAIDTINFRLKQDEFSVVRKNLDFIDNEFLKYAGKYNIPVINTSKHGIDETLEEAKCIIKHS